MTGRDETGELIRTVRTAAARSVERAFAHDTRRRADETIEPWRAAAKEVMLPGTMPEIPTYRVTGEDWDQPIRQQPVPAAAQGAEPAPDPNHEPIVADEAAPANAPLTPPLEEPPATPAPGWAAPAAARAPKRVAVGRKVVAGAAAKAPGSPPRSRLAGLGGRLPPPLGPALEAVPPRFLLGGVGLVVVALLGLVVISGRPTDVAATATAAPTELVVVQTPSCPTPATPLPIPDLVISTTDQGVLRVGGFVAAGELDLDGPWPAELGPVEASVPLGSTMRLTAAGACIAEWRAVAARPPAATGTPWRPETPETIQLGWQRADRIAWEPNVTLPPRGEWIVRVTVWYRDADGSTGPSAAPAPSAGETPADTFPEGWVVERYFRIVVEAPPS